MATRVTITKALEAELREAKATGSEGYTWSGELIDKIVKLLDDEQGKKRAAASDTETKNGLGYKELVALFRSYLGSALLTPPKPNTPYIVKVINKAKEQGIDSTNVAQISNGALRGGRGPYRLFDLVFNADRYYELGNPGQHIEEDGKLGSDDTQAESELRVYTGRPIPGTSEGGGGED